MKESSAVQALAALAQVNRLRAFRMLVVAGHQGATPTTMAKRLKVSGATLSFHLKELMNAGLVTQERRGRHLVYRADFRRMEALLAYLMQNCCQGESCQPPPSA
jgi:ArsR family transcriptional regulator, arsenate/arsenite/antimonite-responsive transcriptional repressor